MDWRLNGSPASVVIAAMAAACAGGAELPALPELPGSNDPTRAQGRVSDVYTLIARGARMCWFGADGALKETHIFHAALDPPSRGEMAEIVIQEIDRTQVSPWGRRTFRVRLTPADGATAIAVENIAMPDDLAASMRADVFKWTEGVMACSTRRQPAATAASAPPDQESRMPTPPSTRPSPAL